MALWSLGMAVAQPTADRTGTARTLWTLAVVDVGLGAAAVLLTRAVETYRAIDNGAPTLPGLWAAGGVFAVALVGGTLGGLAGAAVIGGATLVERGEFTASTVGSVVLVVVAGSVVGYLVATADAAEEALGRALVAQSAAAERERLAREVHDGALQALALLARDATRGMPPAQVAALAAEQEASLRRLLLAGPGGASRGAMGAAASGRATDDERVDLGPAVADVLARALPPSRASLSRPAEPVWLARNAADEVLAAVRAALDNVVRHAGGQAQAFVLVEDEGDVVAVTLRDDGVGMPPGREPEAAAEGRLGLASVDPRTRRRPRWQRRDHHGAGTRDGGGDPCPPTMRRRPPGTDRADRGSGARRRRPPAVARRAGSRPRGRGSLGRRHGRHRRLRRLHRAGHPARRARPRPAAARRLRGDGAAAARRTRAGRTRPGADRLGRTRRRPRRREGRGHRLPRQVGHARRVAGRGRAHRGRRGRVHARPRRPGPRRVPPAGEWPRAGTPARAAAHRPGDAGAAPGRDRAEQQGDRQPAVRLATAPSRTTCRTPSTSSSCTTASS